MDIIKMLALIMDEDQKKAFEQFKEQRIILNNTRQ